MRYPILWERVAPRGLAEADWSWADERLDRLRGLKLEPVVGLLHHGQGPTGMSLMHPGFVAAFEAYARAVAQRFPWVGSYIPINEPLTTARFGGLYGWWQPHAKSNAIFSRLILTQVLAIRAAARAIRGVNSEARIIVNEDVGRTFSTPPLAHEAAHLNERRWLTWDLLFGRVTAEHPMYGLLANSERDVTALADLADDPFVPDMLGVDHYVTSDRFLDHRVSMYVPERRDPSSPGLVDVEACRVRGVPPGSVARAIRDTWRRYRMPIALTEISLAGNADDQVAWWDEAWNASTDAIASGVDIRAVTAWAAFGATDWHTVMRRMDGVYEPGVFDVSTLPPRARPVARAIRASATARRIAVARRAATQPVGNSGWWRKPDRFVLTPARSSG